MTFHRPQTWHHGLMADYWATNNLEAPELDRYRQYLRSPVLDAGCGTGRLLAPLREAGFDVDGCDVSADMIERCRERAPGATLWVSALHELDPPRHYASIVCSGVFGLGSTRDQDIEAVARLHDALLPGGTLVLDNEERPFTWQVRDWNQPSPGPISCSSRVDAVDRADRCVHMTIRAETSDGRREEHRLTMRWWTREELVPLLEGAGFERIDVLDGVDENIVVYVASRHGDLQPLQRRDGHRA
jgi:SAM-dependent methyltransferase